MGGRIDINSNIAHQEVTEHDCQKVDMRSKSNHLVKQLSKRRKKQRQRI
ncbi:MAG: hypothetical protein ACJASQ_003839 [Crocinitomicaceae bacterium]|jgi:hypothetical protein